MPSVLRRSFVSFEQATDDQRQLRVPAKIPRLTRGIEGVEHDLKLVGHGDTDHRRLRTPAHRD